MNKFWSRVLGGFERASLGVWVGAMIGIAMMTPILFKTLESRSLAGEIAGQIFTRMNGLAFVCGIIFLVVIVLQWRKKFLKLARTWVIVAMLALVAVSQFGLRPKIDEIRVQRDAHPADEFTQNLNNQFRILHISSTILFVSTCLLGLGVLLLVQPTRDDKE